MLSRTVGIAVTYEQLWGQMGSSRGAKILSPRLLTDPWTADTAQTALREAGADAARSGSPTCSAATNSSKPPGTGPPRHPNSPAARARCGIAGEQLADLRLSYDSKRRLERAYGGGLILDLAKAELAMVGKLLELGSYGEPLGRELYAAAARLARLVGWAAYDMGYEAAAQRAFVAALRAAHVCGDPRLGSASSAAWSSRPPHRRRPGPGRGGDAHRRPAGRRRPVLTPVERALQLGRIARAHGRRGEREEAETVAARAFRALEVCPGTARNVPTWTAWWGRGTCSSATTNGPALLVRAVAVLSPERARARRC